MPSKVKANAVAAGSAGFLKPTFSSLSKVVEKNENKPPWSKDQLEPQKQPPSKKYEASKIDKKIAEIHLPLVVQESPLHSSSSTTESNSTSKAPESSVESERIAEGDSTEQHQINLPIISNSETTVPPADLENEMKIKDARRVCDELRSQIEDLKNQQKAFQSRLSSEFQQLDLRNDSKIESGRANGNGTSFPNPDVVERKNGKEFEIGNMLPSDDRESLPNVEQMLKDDKDSVLTEDSFNLHGSVTSSDISNFVIKDEWLGSRGLPRDVPPAKVIKRLVAERERYKKKVKHLQVALHRLKKQSLNNFSRMPDIAAHDIVYFNADLIGEGHLSYVYSGTIYKNKKVAIKKLIRPDMMSTSDRSYLAAEAGLLMALHHQNIVEVFGVSTAPLQPLIITELVKGRSLHDRLHTSDGWPLSPVEYYSAVRDVAVGMAYLHGQKPPVLHLNLRPCNILVDAIGRAKVADFGFSKIRLDAGISNQSNLSYLAPELLRFPVHLTTKLDVFSFGVVMWEMATLSKPYKNSSASEILEFVSSGKRLSIPSELPSGFHAIISRCWDHSPMQRPSFKELIILLETMSLPEGWNEAIKRSDLNRADTKGLITPRDGIHPGASNLDGSRNVANRTPVRANDPVQKHSDDEKPERKKLSDELALECDMIALGYMFPKAEIERNDNGNYLKGFKRSNAIQNHSSPYQRKHKTTIHRSLASLSPYKYSFLNGGAVVPSRHGRSPVHGEVDAKPSEVSHLKYKAARNLSRELTTHTESSRYLKVTAQCEIKERARSENDQQNTELHRSANELKSRSSSATDSSSMKNTAGPMPLTDRDLRYHDQDLSVQTPKVITGRSRKNASRLNSMDRSTPRSPEDLRTAVSIPYLKNLHSGDEISSPSANGADSNSSHFDEKLGSYISEACHAESRNFTNAQIKGWRSDRSIILQNQTAAPSDNLKVRNLSGTTPGYAEGGRKISSSAISESPETTMTAVYKPDKAKRKELQFSGRGHKYNDIISPTLSDNTLDETRRIGVLSIPSTSNTHMPPNRPRHASGGSRRIRHVSEGKMVDPNSHPVDRQKMLRRENSWNKLKNSYSPEPLMPHFASPFDTPPRNIPLPPSLNGAEGRERSSAFTGLTTHPSKHSNKKPKKDRHTKRGNVLVPKNGVTAEEVDQESTSTLSSATNDDVGDALTETARELSGVSGILESAVKHRKKNEKTRKKKEQ